MIREVNVTLRSTDVTVEKTMELYSFCVGS
jgi:hypothetical protein